MSDSSYSFNLLLGDIKNPHYIHRIDVEVLKSINQKYPQFFKGDNYNKLLAAALSMQFLKMDDGNTPSNEIETDPNKRKILEDVKNNTILFLEILKPKQITPQPLEKPPPTATEPPVLA